ncbi:unnamed protein product, partial [Porites evermanni]
KITCNGELAFYDQRRDKLVVSRSPANISLWSTSDSGIQVLAVSCHNNKTKPWIKGSVSNGMVTDDRWKCFSQEKEGLDNMSWVTSLFDDTHWAQAVANYSNTHSPWGKVPDISNNAFWISTADKDDSKLICRRRLSEVSLIRKRSNRIFQATLDDVDHSLLSHLRSRHKVRDVIDCFKKCRDDQQCLSFNFQYTTVVPSKNCELNGVTRGQDPKNHVRRPGYTYYENVE